ncbi:polysaccharide biosynthesis/export family protein [Singulisphaera rosea]
MTARTLTPPRLRFGIAFLALAVPLISGCQSFSRHASKKIPQYGVIDPDQPRELQMISLPPYVVEPPDELEVSIRPAVADLSLSTLTVQSDGNIDLGFGGDVYVAGLTLQQVEQKIAQHLLTLNLADKPKEPYHVSVRLVNGSSSKFYYVLGTVTTQGKFPSTGNETVLDAILAAGLRTNSLPEKAYLVRPHPTGGPDQVLKIDWFGIKDRGDNLTNYQVFPGDRIIVPGGKAPGLLSTLMGGG